MNLFHKLVKSFCKLLDKIIDQLKKFWKRLKSNPTFYRFRFIVLRVIWKLLKENPPIKYVYRVYEYLRDKDTFHKERIKRAKTDFDRHDYTWDRIHFWLYVLNIIMMIFALVTQFLITFDL
jgi:hypothetical protein